MAGAGTPPTPAADTTGPAAPVKPVHRAEPVPRERPPQAAPVDSPPPAPVMEKRSIIEVCEAELALKPDALRAARLHFEIARASDDKGTELKHYRAALEAAPDFLPAVRVAREMQLARKNVKAAASLFDAEIKLARDASEMAWLNYEKGCAWLDIEGDQEQARICFAEAARLDAHNPTIVKAMRQAEQRAKDWPSLAKALESEANALADDPRHRAAVVTERARLLERRLRQEAEAVELYETAINLDQTTPVALQELKRLLFTQKRWRDLISVFELEATLTSDEEVRALAYWNIARLHSERLKSRSEATTALEQAVHLSADAAWLEELSRLYQDDHNIAGTASALERLATASSREGEKVAVYQRLAELFDQTDGDSDTAVRWYEQALAIDPGFVPALRALDRLYAKVGNWLALASIYSAEGAAPGASAKRSAAYSRAADILDQHLSRADEAAEHYKAALALDETNIGAFKSLVRLHSAAGRHHELIEIYDRAVDQAKTDDVAIAYLFKIGSLYEDVLHEVPSAVELYKRILGRQPGNLGAIHALQRAAERANQPLALVEALDAEARLSDERTRLTPLAHRAAETIFEALNDADAALPRFEAIIKRDPKHLPTLHSLTRVYRRLGRFKELMTVYERLLEATESTTARVSLLLTMGELAETSLGDDAQAINWHRRALQLDPAHGLARAAVVRLLRRSGDYAGLAGVLHKDVARLTQPLDKARNAMILGEVLEIHLGKPDDAIAAYRHALDAVPQYRPALDAIARVYGVQGSWRELGDALLAEAEGAKDTRMALDARLRAAMLEGDRLSHPDQAQALVEHVLQHDPQNLAALIALERLLIDKNDGETLAALYAREATVFAHPAARVASLVSRGRILENGQAEDRDHELRSACTAILAADGSNPWALGALGRLADKTDDHGLRADVAARVAEAVGDDSLRAMHYTRLGDELCHTNAAAALKAYNNALALQADNLGAIRGIEAAGSALGDAATVVDAYRREARFRRDDRAAADLYVQASAVLSRIGDSAGAVADAERALAQCPDHEAAPEMLRHLLVASGNTEHLVELLSQAAHMAKNPGRKLALWCSVGAIQADRHGDIGAAITAVKRALEAKPKDVGAIMQLADLHMRDSQHEEAADLYARAVAIDEGNIEAHRRLARIFTEHAPDPKRAHGSLQKVLKHDPNDRDALRMQLQLHIDAGDRDRARAVSEQLLGAAGDDDDTRSWALAEIARVELKAGDHQRAADALHHAVVLTGIHGDAVKVYRQLLGDKEPWTRYLDALRQHIRLCERKHVDPALLAEVFLEIADVQQRKLERPHDAFDTLEKGIARCGDRPGLAIQRAEMLVTLGRHADAVGAFQQIVTRDPLVSEAWRALVRALQHQARQTEAGFAVGPLLALGVATDVERNLAQERALRPGLARAGSFGRATLRAISAGEPEGEERVAAVFGAVADGLSKAFAPQFEVYGVRKGDRIKPRTPHPVRQDVDRLAQVFGFEEFDLYVHAGLAGDVTVELSDPPAIMVPAHVADMPEAQRVFLLSRALAAVTSGLHPALKLAPADVALALAAAVRRLVPSFEDGVHDQDSLAVVQERLAPSWFGRGKVDEAVQRYYAEPLDPVSWAPTVERTVTRAAALLAGDLEACVAALRAVGAVPGDLEGAKLIKKSPVLDDLLRFWTSEQANDARRVAGMI